MIKTEQQFWAAQQAIQNLQKILLEARNVHTPKEYRAMSEPVLLEIQQREQDVLDYLQRTEEELVAA